MAFRIHGVPEFHFHAIADGAGDILKRGRRWRGFDHGAFECRTSGLTSCHRLTVEHSVEWSEIGMT